MLQSGWAFTTTTEVHLSFPRSMLSTSSRTTYQSVARHSAAAAAAPLTDLEALNLGRRGDAAAVDHVVLIPHKLLPLL